MSAHTLENASSLTEHFDFPPVSLVDDIINSVNMLMYKCTEAMEQYLLKSLENDNNIEEKQSYIEEIKVGTSKLESLLEHSVDTQFDKLELYLLRNVLNVPDMDSRFFRLRHQLGLEKVDGDEEEKMNLKINSLCQDVDQEMKYNKILMKKVLDFKRLQLKVSKFKKTVSSFFTLSNLEGSSTSELSSGVLKTLTPIDATISQLLQYLNNIVGPDSLKDNDEELDGIRDKLKEFLDVDSDTVISSGSRLQYLNLNYKNESAGETPYSTNVLLE